METEKNPSWTFGPCTGKSQNSTMWLLQLPSWKLQKTHYEFLVFALGNHRIPQCDYHDNHPGNYKKPIMNLNGLQMGNDKIPKCD